MIDYSNGDSGALGKVFKPTPIAKGKFGTANYKRNPDEDTVLACDCRPAALGPSATTTSECPALSPRAWLD